MTTLKGDLLEMAVRGDFDLIAHGANCFCTMGAGIARQIKEVFPEAFEADRRTTKGDWGKFGGLSLAEVSSGNGGRLFVANLYSQFYPGGPNPPKDGREARLGAIRSALSALRSRFPGGARVGLPKIGAGLAGGDWAEIGKAVEEIFPEATVVVL